MSTAFRHPVMRLRSRLVCFGVTAAIALAPLVAAGQPAPDREAGAQPAPAGEAGERAWQRQQPTRERARALAEREGVMPSLAERREELRTLNEVHRELMPPGTVVPAPDLARPDSRRERN